MQIRIPAHRPYFGAEESRAIQAVLDSRWLGRGRITKEFEDRICEYLGVKHAIAVNSGTAALHMAVGALDVSPDDEVIVPSLTFVSSVQAILAAGARPVFCEVRKQDLNIDVADVAGRITPRTRAIMPVHFGGRVCDMEGLYRLTAGRGIRIVEDAAHAFGSSYGDRWAGALGDLGCFSFDPIKNITCGGGGAVVTDDDELSERVRVRHNVGLNTDSWSRLTGERPWYYTISEHGYRYYLGNLNAAIGLEQMKRLEDFRIRKLAIARRYDDAVAQTEGLAVIPHCLEGVFPFNYVTRVLGGRRDGLMAWLKERGIGSTIQFIPNHLQPAFSASRCSLPVTEELYREIVTLPLYYEMTDGDVEEVVREVRAFLASRSAGGEQAAAPAPVGQSAGD
ncbi:MAG: DegT/DnrJ/EryC1/StrS family aminotransferase [Bryobacteraceae bacterium]|nr:DegT/DnrJ/EryC1/StrS family aminotransferase [Bryobacteraceae bacterium]